MKCNYQRNTLTKQSGIILTNIVVFIVTPVCAQITPDNSLGTENSRITPNTLINGASSDLISGGTLRSSNLFHSFSQFNIQDGQRIYFANPSGVLNIITRVTGASPSNLNGTLGVNGAANLFLINPNGILFGKNSSLDIRGSFVGTTANGLQFGNQGIFSAANPEVPALLTINPSAFLFNQINPGAINIQSQAPAGVNPNGVPVTGLRVPQGQSLLFVGGDINLDSGKLRAYDANVQLAAVKAPGTVGLNITGNNFSLSIPNDIERADISLQNQAAISTFGALGGNINIYARNLNISNSSVSGGIGQGLGNINTQAGDVNLNATGIINLSQASSINSGTSIDSKGNGGNLNIIGNSLFLNNASIGSIALGQGNSGNININTKDNVTLDGQGDNGSSLILNGIDTLGVGKAGDIQITTGSLKLNNASVIGSNIAGQGNGSNITINAKEGISLTNGSSIFNNVEDSGVGNAGDIKLTTDNLSIRNVASVSSFTYGKGNAANIFINSQDINIDGAFSYIISDVPGNALGKGGNIQVDTRTLSLTNGGQIASNVSENDAGNIIINARDSVNLDGTGVSASGIQTQLLSGTGKSGDIQITTGSLTAKNGATVSASTTGQGNAGNIAINASGIVTLNSDGQSSATSINTAIGESSVGKGGDIRVNAKALFLQNGSLVYANSFGQGNAGNISINTQDKVVVDGANGNKVPSGISTFATGGDGGNIEIMTGNLLLTNGGNLNSFVSRTTGTPIQASAGNIRIATKSFFVSNGGYINSSTAAIGNAGNIIIDASDSITLDGANNRDTRIYGTVLNDGIGRGGDIRLTTQTLSAINGAQISVTSAGQGNAGDINVNSSIIRLDNNSSITATTNFSDGGNIKLTANDYLLLRRGSSISTSAGLARAEGNGGNITINTPFIVAVPNEISDIIANAFTGNGGQVNIRVQSLFGIEPRAQQFPQSSYISASSQFGVQGEVNVTQPEVQPTQQQIELPGQILDASNQISPICPTGDNAFRHPLGEFTVTGRGSLPPSPLEPLPGTTNNTPLAALNTNNSKSAPISKTQVSPTPIIEAHGFVKTADGTIELVGMAPTATPSNTNAQTTCPQI